eukprot:TRINITY_DN2883_c0_g1_i2.p1 TRINITY_DN2883_c0_g1~~TRINITY_DN2883_c0_g1_i2.p1  ORF type:complete len:191 (+),score=33.54 TRINITY_DN2883_c0_g1_i2:12-584(+)
MGQVLGTCCPSEQKSRGARFSRPTPAFLRRRRKGRQAALQRESSERGLLLQEPEEEEPDARPEEDDDFHDWFGSDDDGEDTGSVPQFTEQQLKTLMERHLSLDAELDSQLRRTEKTFQAAATLHLATPERPATTAQSGGSETEGSRQAPSLVLPEHVKPSQPPQPPTVSLPGGQVLSYLDDSDLDEQYAL